jgi:4-diphosphocytidyl-2C-methyl-D-erythritol kinase
MQNIKTGQVFKIPKADPMAVEQTNQNIKMQELQQQIQTLQNQINPPTSTTSEKIKQYKDIYEANHPNKPACDLSSNIKVTMIYFA